MNSDTTWTTVFCFAFDRKNDNKLRITATCIFNTHTYKAHVDIYDINHFVFWMCDVANKCQKAMT